MKNTSLLSFSTYPARNHYHNSNNSNTLRRCKRQSWATNKLNAFRKSWIGFFNEKVFRAFFYFSIELNFDNHCNHSVIT